MSEIVFAYPGDLQTLTGGYVYDRQLIEALRATGQKVRTLALGEGFPHPDAATVATAIDRLAAATGDVLIVDGLAYGRLPAEGLARVGVPMIALVHHPLALETGLSPEVAAAFRADERAALQECAAVLVTSPHTAAVVRADFAPDNTPVTVAPPGLDRAFWGGLTKAPEAVPRVVSVASISPRKGFDVLVDALARVADRPFAVDIVGSLTRDPNAAAVLKDDIAERGLSHRVTLHGEAPDTVIRTLYSRADVFALASRYEGFGMVFAEAMAAGLPVVGCRGGAVPDVVPEEAGVLVAVDDAPGFAEALSHLLSDAGRRAQMGEAAKKAADRCLTWPETAAIVSDLIGTVRAQS
ncbi:MAG: glycosyltransferase family 4 protein [Pseudomonadota bacterium]